ncbi:MFS transporter [Microlunatus ginsengisoli]|uniref:Sugar efflux transporter n=1 Tax=Microlunatus ginsengisoli TaxID=363863 RepID=A0ABP7A645_9ACTN
MSSVATPPAVRTSATRLVLGHRLYRGATVAMFLSGLGFSAAAPQIARFLVTDLGASLPMAGLYYLTNLTAPVAGYLIGSRSDRTGRRLGLFRWCAVAGFLGWAGIAFSTQLWMPFVISALVLGFAGAAGSQLFAALRDELDSRPAAANEGVVAIVRMALTAGWVVGPVLGAWFAAQFGLRALLLATAVCTLAQILPMGALRSAPPVSFSAPSADRSAAGAIATVPGRRPALRVMLPLLAFTGLYVLVYAGESIKYAYLPIYMNEQLRLAPAVSGAVIGIQPLVELILMPFSVIVGRRIGYLPLMAIGAGFGVAANLCFALTGSAAGMFAGQILMGGVWGVFAALGIIVAQRLLPSAVATASAIFMSSTAVSSALGGLTGGVGVALLGLPQVFWIPALFALLAVVGLVIMSRKTTVDS